MYVGLLDPKGYKRALRFNHIDARIELKSVDATLKDIHLLYLYTSNI